MMNWKQRLERAQKSKRFTQEDKSWAELWITDPISELTDKITLKNNDLAQGPNDIYDILDGIFFTKGVEEDDIGLAMSCYMSIHKRIEKIHNT